MAASSTDLHKTLLLSEYARALTKMSSGFREVKNAHLRIIKRHSQRGTRKSNQFSCHYGDSIDQEIYYYSVIVRTAAAAGTMIALFFPTGYIDFAQVPVQWVTFFFSN